MSRFIRILWAMNANISVGKLELTALSRNTKTIVGMTAILMLGLISFGQMYKQSNLLSLLDCLDLM